MNKSQTLRDPRSCLNKAQTDEPVFVLKASDPLFAQTIHHWQAMADGIHSPEKRAEACKVAAEGEGWRKSRQAQSDHVNKLQAQGLGAAIMTPPPARALGQTERQLVGAPISPARLAPSYERDQEEQRNRALPAIPDAAYLRDMAQFALSSTVRNRLLAIAETLPPTRCTAPPPWAADVATQKPAGAVPVSPWPAEASARTFPTSVGAAADQAIAKGQTAPAMDVVVRETTDVKYDDEGRPVQTTRSLENVRR